MTVDDVDVDDRRPGLTLLPEHMVDVPVWHGPNSKSIGNLSADELMALGVSSRMIERLRAWQEGWENDPLTGGSPPDFRWRSPLTVRLAQDLQRELSGYRIFLVSRDGPVPVEDRRG